MKSIITYKQILEERFETESMRMLVQNEVKKYAEEFFKKEVINFSSSYLPDYGMKSFLKDEIQKGNAKRVTAVLDYFEYRQKYIDIKDDDFYAEDSAFNYIYHFEEFDILFVYYQFLNKLQLVIYSEREENVVEFVRYFKIRNRELEKQYIKIYTDTRDGTTEENMKIKNEINKEEVFMDEKIKKEIYQSVDYFFNNPEFYRENQIPYKRGIILYGKPGNGKTTLIKSFLSTLKVPITYFQVTEFTTSGSIKRVFNRVFDLAPAVLIIEDIDSMPVGSRSTFLNILDGVTSKEGIFVIGTTNYPEKIDAGLMNRAGRFDKAYEVKAPSEEIREKFFKQKLNKLLTDYSYIAKNTEGFTLAQMSELATQILLKNHYGEEVRVDILINDYKQLNKKQESNKWNSEDEKNIGFYS